MNPQLYNTEENLEEWIDNSEAKDRIKDWLVSERKFSILIVDCSQQLMDLSKWIKNNTSINTLIGEFTSQSDLPMMKWKLIKHLVSSLDKEIKFKIFHNKLEEIKSFQDLGIYCNQKNDIQSTIAGTKTGDIHQHLTINVPENPFQEFKIEYYINSLVESFLDDLSTSEFVILLLIKFGRGGLESLSLEFKNWFIEEFCRNTILQSNVKICVLNEGNIDEVYIEDIFKESFGGIKNEVLLKETKKYIQDNKVCDTICTSLMAFNDYSPIPYSSFKRTLVANILRQRVEYDPRIQQRQIY